MSHVTLAQTDNLVKSGFDLNSQTSDGHTPIRALMDSGASELVAPLVARGLSTDAAVRDCRDQYWYAQSIAMSPKGLEILAALVKAGFKEDCLRSRPGGDEGFVCGVLFGSSAPTFDVGAAVRAVEQIASMGFDVGAKCLGKTITQSIEQEKDAERRRRLTPIAEAVRRHARK